VPAVGYKCPFVIFKADFERFVQWIKRPPDPAGSGSCRGVPEASEQSGQRGQAQPRGAARGDQRCRGLRAPRVEASVPIEIVSATPMFN